MALRGITGVAGTAASTSASITYAGAANIQIGDLVILVSHLVVGSSGGTFTDPTGWTPGSSLSPALPDVFNSVTGSDYYHVAVKIAAAGDAGTPSYTTSSSLSGYWHQQIRAYSGRANGSIAAAFANQVATASGASTLTPYTANLTGLTAANGDDVVAFTIGTFPSGNSGGTAWAGTSAGYANALNTYYAGYNYNGFVNSLDYVNNPGGATGSIPIALTATGGNTFVSAYGFVMSLGAGGGGGPSAALATAAGGLASLGGQLGGPWAAQMAAKATWTDLAWLSSRMGAIASAQPSRLLNWASVTLTAPLYQGLGGALDGYLWTIATPKAGTVVYYDPSNMSIASDGSITATSNNFSALIGFYDPAAGWQSALYTISPGDVGYAIGYASLTATLSGNLRPLAAAASDLASFAASLSSIIKLSASAGGIASAGAALINGVALADAAAALASVSAGLTSGIALADAASGLARATIAMQTAIQAATLAAGLASAAPALTTHIQLSAQAAGKASGTPTLTNTVAAALASAAGDIASAAINLSTTIAAISAPNAIASGQPFLTTPKPLLAAASGLASGSFAMRTGAGFQTLAAGLASGAAALQTQGAFASLGRAIASMSASLFTLPVLTMPILLAHQIPGIYQPGPFPQGQFQIGAGTESVFGIDWTYWICFLWQPGYSAALNYVIRPFPWTGLQYICTTAGQTGNYPPIWPEEIGQLVVDGSVVWTAEAIDNTSLQTTVLSATYSAPAGITASPYAVAGQVTPVAINASAAVAGQTYEVICTALMASGDFLIGQLIFDVN